MFLAVHSSWNRCSIFSLLSQTYAVHRSAGSLRRVYIHIWRLTPVTPPPLSLWSFLSIYSYSDSLNLHPLSLDANKINTSGWVLGRIFHVACRGLSVEEACKHISHPYWKGSFLSGIKYLPVPAYFDCSNKYFLLKTYILTEIQVQVSRVLWLRVSHKAAIEGRSRAGVISRLHWGEICSQAHAPGCWQPSVLPGFGQRYQCLATWPCLKVPYNMTACFLQHKSCKRGWTRWKPVFCNLISELTLIYAIFSFRRHLSLDQAHVQGEGIRQRHENQEAEIIGDHLSKSPRGEKTCKHCHFFQGWNTSCQSLTALVTL